MPLVGLLADERVQASAIALVDQKGVHLLPPGRQLVDHGDVQIAIEKQRQRARNRRGRHNQKMRLLTLAQQGGALRHAEAVLLVGDHQSEPFEHRRLAEQGVRPDDQVDRSGLQRLAALRLLLRRHRADQQPAGDAQRPEHRRKALVMLPRKELRRRHERHLRTVFGRAAGRRRRDHGLAAADVALHQPAHRHAAPEILKNFVDRALLRAGQPERQSRKKRRGATGVIGRGVLHGTPRAHERQRQREVKELLKHQPPPRRLKRLHAPRLMDLPIGLLRAAEVIVAAQALRQRLGQRNALQRMLHGLRDLPAAQPRRQRIDRHDAPRHAARRVQRLKLRVDHRVAQIVPGHRSVEAIALAAVQPLHAEGRVEKGQIQPPGVVGHGQLRDLRRAAAPLGDAVRVRLGHDSGQKARGRVDLQRCDRQKPCPILIVAREEAHQLPQRPHAEPREKLGLFRPDARKHTN